MTYGSLFAGIGGIDLGLERAGMSCAWQVEIAPYCVKVLQKHWPEVARYGDVRECGSANLVPVDLICGGFPCQPHSLAGKRAASGDERDLWGEFARVVCELRPRWVLAENVPGLLSSESGRFFGRVLRDLAALGYCVEWESIPASAVGAPHMRDRVFVVARAKSAGRTTRTSERITGGCCTMAYSQGEHGEWSIFGRNRGWRSETETRDSGDAPDAYRESSGRITESRRERSQWAVEPDVGRVAHGVPSRVDRLRCLGNAVVPQVAEWIGRQILSADRIGT
jgi:DNA (cytosine-5)-methyltransferase 1